MVLQKAKDQVNSCPEQIKVFIGAKSALANVPLLVHPVLQASIAFSTDASNVAMVAVVEQHGADA